MHSAIGKGLRQSPRLLATTSAVALALVTATLILTTPPGQELDSGRGFTYTLATIACLYLGFVASLVPGTAPSFGFRLSPRQGWLYWLWVSPAIGLVQLIVWMIWDRLFAGMNLGRPEAVTWGRFLSLCVIAPVAEEIVYRMIICPSAVALMGPWSAIAISGAVFAYAHYIAGVASPDNQMGGFVLAWIFVKSESIILPIALHSISNVFPIIVGALLLAGPPPAPLVQAEKKHLVEENGIKSVNADVETSITFVNKTRQTIKIFWLDYDGQRQLCATIDEGQAYEHVRTYLTQPWLVTDEEDQAWYVYFPDAQERTIEVVAPGKK